jgi:dinuclear metal center YbgI/SA1388 family protein
MTQVADVTGWLDEFAPPSLAEPWDNVGLLWGDPNASLTRVMTCLTVTAVTAHEAIEQGAGLIVSHHPVLFKAVKAVRADRPDTGFLWELGRSGISVTSPHTAFDNAVGGINDGLARRLGLLEIGPLRTMPAPASFKVVIFVPPDSREAVLSAAFAAGAGRIGAYDECSFTGTGEGTFFGTGGANPAIGQAGRRETVRERRVELVCPAERIDTVLAAIRSRHPYEEPATDVYPLHPPARTPGVGRVGRLGAPTSLAEFAAAVGQTLNAHGVQFVGAVDRRVERVAIACGAGDDFVGDAARVGADVLLTGEARFHRALEADALEVGLVVAGHHATERPGVEDLAERLGAAFPSLTVWASRLERDPLTAVT